MVQAKTTCDRHSQIAVIEMRADDFAANQIASDLWADDRAKTADQRKIAACIDAVRAQTHLSLADVIAGLASDAPAQEARARAPVIEQ
jgi:hypothetical protein